jgi:hypothetical protein
VTKFNRLCKALHKHIEAKHRPRGAVVPEPLKLKGLFEIDIDNPIWYDKGLGNDKDEGTVLRWLGDNAVRSGIVGLLEIDQCKEEALRLKCKHSNMQHWFSEEWDVVRHAHHTAEGLSRWKCVRS